MTVDPAADPVSRAELEAVAEAVRAHDEAALQATVRRLGIGDAWPVIARVWRGTTDDDPDNPAP